MNKAKIGQVWKYESINDTQFTFNFMINKIYDNKVNGIIIYCSNNTYQYGYEYIVYLEKALWGKWSLFKDRVGDECVYCNKFYNESKFYNKVGGKIYAFCCWECDINLSTLGSM